MKDLTGKKVQLIRFMSDAEMKIKAMINFAYFTANFPHNFIEMCWADDSHLIDHLNTKFMAKVKGSFVSVGDFMSFFFDLDRENQRKLAEWIELNYTA